MMHGYNHNTDDKAQLINDNLDIVKKIAFFYVGRVGKVVEVDDLLQLGMVGLIEAAHNYTPQDDVSFVNYARLRVKGAIVDYLRYFGAAFLVVYGLRAFLSAMRGGSAMECGADENDFWKSIAICLMLTWLNPHVYLDTVVLVGSLAAQSADPWVFGTGAISASFVFFFSLGYGARFLSPVFQNPRAWQILDIVIALVMWSIAYGLLFGM